MSSDATTICFGLDTDLDRNSCAVYLQLLGRPQMARTLADRLSSQEIEQLVDLCSTLLRRHLSKQEYHKLFLRDDHHHDPTDNSHD